MMEEGQIAKKRINFEEIMKEKGEEDAISALPDCLLLEILSRLPSITDAIRTGTLSKRWERLWTFIPTLIFTPSRRCILNLNSESDFALLVSKTLTQCRQLKRKKFKVLTFYDIRYESHFNDWIRYAISCNVEELNLNLGWSEAEFLLDQTIFINSCFIDLRLQGCKLNPTGAISWENLRSLCISRAIIDEELIVKIVSGSPLLETLVLERCRWPDITSESESDSDDIIGISAPTSLLLTQCRQLEQLKKFKIEPSYSIKFQSQLNNWIHYAIRCNVQELDLMFWNENEDVEDGFVLDQIVFTGSCLTELRLDECMLNPVGAISWENLRSLCISRTIIDEELIVKIVSGSPLLETLVLERCRWPDITSESESDSDDIIGICAPTSLLLTQCRQLEQLKKFKVETSYSIKFQSQLNNWIHYAIRCNVQELDLMFWNENEDVEDGFVLDQIVFTGSCLTELRLDGCMLNPVGAISWKNLRSLCISNFQSLDEDLIENISSGSPVLESLVLEDCYGYRRLDITSKSVKNLKLCQYYPRKFIIYSRKIITIDTNKSVGPYDESEADIIEINAPNILSLSIIVDPFLCKPLLLNVSSVVKAYLDCPHLLTTPKEAEQEILKVCIMNLRHVKELELGFPCSEVLSCLQAKGFVSPQNVKLNIQR